MRKIVISVRNCLLAEALTELLRKTGEFDPLRVAADRKKTVPACAAYSPDIVLMEVSQAPGASIAVRMEEVKLIRQLPVQCKVVLLCDENVSPEIARDVVTAKKNGVIDAFYYSSVTGKYLVAALYAL